MWPNGEYAAGGANIEFVGLVVLWGVGWCMSRNEKFGTDVPVGRDAVGDVERDDVEKGFAAGASSDWAPGRLVPVGGGVYVVARGEMCSPFAPP